MIKVTEEDLVSRSSPARDLRPPALRSPDLSGQPDLRPPDVRPQPDLRAPDLGLARIAASMNQHLTELVGVLQVREAVKILIWEGYEYTVPPGPTRQFIEKENST